MHYKIILSISGGGIRGLIPAMVLAEIERRASKSISSCCDVIAGTSTGGIIASLLATPNSCGVPKYTADEVVHLYRKFGKSVFKRTVLRKIATLDGLIGVKYKTTPLTEMLQGYFGYTKLSDTTTNLILPSYQVSNTPYPHFFKTHKARKETLGFKNPYLWECVRSTTAANSYFKPYCLDENHIMLDGGVFANNPAMCAYSHAIKKRKQNDEHDPICIISLGTGENPEGLGYDKIKKWGILQWAVPLFRQSSISSDETVHYMLKSSVLGSNSDKYFRLQATLDNKSTSIDNASDENIERLERAAKQMIADNSKLIDDICEIILNQAR